ncbi:hypothetical protein [Piscinibacter gummiphilus]|uniref:Uncharacterized protein n=1 Tax=Piscinibacter gummiphilus TaxID=946333 RepID=A0ABZ0D263_9BURK|nr:hypothetical protein [Piscinibacter gummiphilus]WOB11335.1 hypothetical protein RXV79_28040 [Piscinibacter gummiphilus]
MIFTSSEPWSLYLEGEVLTFEASESHGNRLEIAPETLTVRLGVLWATVTFTEANRHQHRKRPANPS